MGVSELIDKIDNLLSSGATISAIRSQLTVLREQTEALEQELKAFEAFSDQPDNRGDRLQMLLDRAYEEIERLQAEAEFNFKKITPKPESQRHSLPAEITQISLSDIVRRFKVTPPFHQDDFHKEFLDIRVSWSAYLTGITRQEDYVIVMARIGEACQPGALHLFCTTTEADVDVLASAPNEARIQVTGIIYHVAELGARLSDCTFMSISEEPPLLKMERKVKNSQDSPPLVLADLLKIVNGAPPFQRGEIEQSFVGMRVKWRGTLFSVSHNPQKVSVTLKRTDGYGLIFCNSDPSRSMALMLAREGAEIEVSGEIQSLSFEPELTDCSFSIL